MFTRFPDLPPELRNYIWHLALPDEIRPGVLFQFRRGCWGPLPLTESHLAYDPATPDDNIALEFFPDRLEPIQARIPHLLVNKEAHGIARSWVRKRGFGIQYCLERAAHMATRQFDPEHDTLYLPSTLFQDFCVEPLDRQAELDLMERIIHSGEGLSRIAVSTGLLRSEFDAIDDIRECFPQLKVMFLIDEAPDHLAAEEAWEIQQGGSFVYDSGHGLFEWSDGKCHCKECVHGSIKKIIHDDIEVEGGVYMALHSSIPGFEVRLVSVIERGVDMSKLPS
ncbi:hypothetical protein BO71DRAFT_39540 [Aspergillus ellipticus CBS 707.79]|uniref:2EXR domain-containing protein n=1 Tax=Aspergillus ellipticus CBS 707.79 TaxID=1448320 RepID=A0A319D3W9_9EURO|nr:hypothetical protein BO71DRAFT_39540 [Aspergillus ellipticus CBS 707.79]